MNDYALKFNKKKKKKTNQTFYLNQLLKKKFESNKFKIRFLFLDYSGLFGLSYNIFA
jgi:hypothetical protein